MAVEIVSGVSSTKWTVDSTSKAGRVTLYDSSGNELRPAPTGSYLAHAQILGSSGWSAGNTLFALTNSTTKTMYIRKIFGSILFEGTAAAATTNVFEIERTTAGTPTGGNADNESKKNTSYAASAKADLRYGSAGTALTTTGVTFETPIIHIALPVSSTSGNYFFSYTFDLPNQKYSPFELGSSQGIVLRANTAITVDTDININIEWDER